MTRARLSRLVWPAIVFGLALVVFGFSAFLDPDPHHDGVQIAPAIAIAEGKTIHLDVFDHYGPVTAWLHAAAILVAGPYLLVIKIVTAILLAATASITFAIARRTLRWPVLPLLLTVTWVALWPGRSVDWVTSIFLPWPSVLFLFLQVLIALVMLEVVGGRLNRPWLLGTVGALTGLAFMVRMNYGLALAIVVLAAVVFLVDGRSGAATRRLAVTLTGMLVAVTLILLVLAASGALGAFVDDAVAGPLQGSATGSFTPWFYYKNVVLLGSVPVIASVLAVYLAGRLWPRRQILAVLLGGAGTLALVLWASTSLAGSPLRDLILARLTWAPVMDLSAFQPMYAVVLLMPVAGVVLLREILRGTQDQQVDTGLGVTARLQLLTPATRSTAVLGLLAAASLIQLFPISDAQHLWWAAPLPLILVTHILTRGLTRPWAAAMAAVLFIPPLVLAVPRAWDYASQPRERIERGVLAGMYIGSDRTDDVRAVDDLLAVLQPGANRFDCADGLFAVWTGRYLADSSAFVSWAPGFTGSAQPAPDGYLVRCLPPNPDGTAVDLPVPMGFELVSRIGPVSLSYYNWGTIELLRPTAG